jgi:CDP-diacylglycerol--glycerol-3-phosphate 3-phosphatidyltransferase
METCSASAPGAQDQPPDDERGDARGQLPSRAARQRFGRAGALTLTTIRLLLGPVMVLVAIGSADGRILAGAVIVATLSDIFDGKVARRYGVATAGLRRFDSIADTVFYIGAGSALWLRHADVLTARMTLIVAFLVMQVGGHLLDVWKFGRDTSYHTWTGRAFGILLGIATTGIFWTGRGGEWLTLALAAGIVAHVDALVISLILPDWQHDVHHVRNALRLRRAKRRLREGS